MDSKIAKQKNIALTRLGAAFVNLQVVWDDQTRSLAFGCFLKIDGSLHPQGMFFIDEELFGLSKLCDKD